MSQSLKSITQHHHQRLKGHRSVIAWFTGLSGSGKSTLAHAVDDRLHQMGIHTVVLDGEKIRQGLCADLGFSAADRSEHSRRIGETAKLFLDAGVIVLAAVIAPFRADRQRVRQLVAPGDFLEIYCNCSLAICEQRDVKGLYQRVRHGEIPNFTGITSPYEPPVGPELELATGSASLEVCVEQVLALLRQRQILSTDIEIDAGG
jgi:adenylylsulfate kinase